MLVTKRRRRRQRYFGVSSSVLIRYKHTANSGRNCFRYKIVGFLKRNVGPGNKEVFSRLYKALVIPILEYGVPLWSPYSQKNIDALERVQRKGSKYPLSNSIGTLRMKKDWHCLGGPLSNQLRRSYLSLLECYKTIHGLNVLNCTE